MRQATHSIEISTRGKGLTALTPAVATWVGDQGIVTGLLTVFCRHTSASLIIQENADPDVRTDLEAYFETIAPEDPGRYVHGFEGPDDMPAHIRTALTASSLSIPVVGGRMALGTW
ncbi:MAG: secondary thiamine-phosphate synthase enzyme YjbQ, partial [Bauldia sp.]|nr:secondary thiamine-phosphate synthase enzyme YjbQ [Bauldia sp.]